MEINELAFNQIKEKEYQDKAHQQKLRSRYANE